MRVKQLHTKDLAEGYGAVYLPYALERKYRTPTVSGAGNTCLPPKAALWTPARLPSVAITWMKAAAEKPCAPRTPGRDRHTRHLSHLPERFDIMLDLIDTH